MKSRTTGKRGALALGLIMLVAGGMGACSSKPPATGGGEGGGFVIPHGGAGGFGGEGGTGGAGGVGGSGGEVIPPCEITAVNPRRGSTNGGERVTLTGLNFQVRGDQQVSFGSLADNGEIAWTPALNVASIDSDTILATTPPGSPGDVRVQVTSNVSTCECADCFRYQGPVRIDALVPPEGYLYGGTTVKITGENLRAEMIVLFGNRRAFDVTENTDGSLSVVTPPGDAEGAVDVRVFDGDGAASLRRSFTYRDRVSVDRVVPPGGPLAGGNQVTVFGTGFGAGLKVFFGGTEADVLQNVDGSLSVTVPQGAAIGPVEVAVQTTAGSGARAAAYAYFDPEDPTVQLFAVAPGRGPLAGNNTATLVGSGLDAGLLVARFGGMQATVKGAVDPHFANVDVPPGSALGAVDVSVRVSGGGSSLAAAYEYVNPLRISKVLPDSGPEDGGTSITILGNRFPATPRVFVGAFEATNVVRISENEITAVTPRGTDGVVPVRVVEAGNPENEGVLGGAFVYEGEFSFVRIDPVVGSRAGGTRVELMGTGFRDDLLASFGATDAVTMDVQSPFIAVAVTPRGEVGTVDVTTVEALGNGVLPGAFSYFNPASSAGGSSGGALRGTLNVTVLDGGRARGGLPLPDSLVIVGTDDSTALECERGGRRGVEWCLTDDRGQITFSDPSLVKAQVVSVSHPGYEHTTVVNQSAENLTVYLTPNGEPTQCQDELDNDGDGRIDFGQEDPPIDETGPREEPDGRPDDSDWNCICGSDLEPEGMEELCVCPSPFGPPIETNPCCDGMDNDNDGLMDKQDADCACTQGYSEGPLAECGDCKDNDGDGLTDGPPSLSPTDPACADKGGLTERGGVVAGAVYGFKAPRELAANETEIAYVGFSVASVYSLAPPFRNANNVINISEVTIDGGTYKIEFPGRQQLAMYAVYGIKRDNTFEPVLMGIARGVITEPGKPVTANILLDMHLDTSVNVHIDNSPARDLTTEVLAFLDVGKDGVILLRQGMTARSAPVSAATPDTTTLNYLPNLAGESFIFQVFSFDGQDFYPFATTFRRQPGSLVNGVTIGPLMNVNRIIDPPADFPVFDGVVEWAGGGSGPDAELAQVQILQPTIGDPIPRWNMVLPGKEKRVAVPDKTMEELRTAVDPDPGGTQLNIFLTTAREPRFAFDQWTYDNLSPVAFTSFSQHGVATFLLPFSLR